MTTWPIVTTDHHAAADRVLRSGRLTDGAEVEAFESEFAAAVGADYAVMTNSGTSAIHAAILANGARTAAAPSLSFSGTVLGAVLSGLRVHYLDVDPATGSVPLDSWSLSDAEILIPVHLHGNAAPVPLDSDTFVIEDCAQAFGTLDETGRQVGYLGDCAAWSLNATKIMWAGEGGMLTTDDRSLADEARSIVRFGGNSRNTYRSGYNWKGDEMRAALGRASLMHVDRWLADGRQAGAIIDAIVAESDTLSPLSIVGTPNRHKYRLRVPTDSKRFAERALLAGAEVTSWQDIPLPVMSGLKMDPSVWGRPQLAEWQCSMNLLSRSVIVGSETRTLSTMTATEATALAETLVRIAP